MNNIQVKLVKDSYDTLNAAMMTSTSKSRTYGVDIPSAAILTLILILFLILTLILTLIQTQCMT